MKKFRHLHVPDHWEQYWSRYPQGYTILEALINWVGQVDDMVDNQNALNKTVEDFRKELDDFVEAFDPKLQEKVVDTLYEWQQSGFLDVVIDQALQTQIDDVSAQLAQTEQESLYRGLNVKVPFGTNLTPAKGDGKTDDTQSIIEMINYCVANKIPLVIPKADYVTSLIQLENIDGLTIEFIDGARFVNIPNVNNRGFISIKNCKNINLFNPNVDGGNCYSRGILILENNDNIKVFNPIIKNISPLLTDTNPEATDSNALYFSITNNINIYIENIKIDSVKNNNNGVIGDDIGSSRGIMVRPSDNSLPVKCENVIFNKVNITNVESEDGDAIHFIGKNGSNETVDIKMFDVTTDYTKRRALKFQFINGVYVDKIKIKQSDKSTPMESGIAMLTSGNTIKNIEMDIYAKRGIEFSPFQDDDFKSIIQNIKIKLENVPTIDGSTVYGIDVVDYGTGVTTSNLDIDGVDIKSPNTSIYLRSFTRDVRLNNLKLFTYGSPTISAIGLSYDPSSKTAKDGTNVSHKGLYIDNVKANSGTYYASTATTFEESFLGISQNDLNINPYITVNDMKGSIQITPRVFKPMSAMPTSGTYFRHDYVQKNGLFKAGETGNRYIVRGWLRITDGSNHTLGVDWLEDRIYTGD